jgi:hypothetical protein
LTIRNVVERGAASGVPALFAGATIASDERGSPVMFVCSTQTKGRRKTDYSKILCA